MNQAEEVFHRPDLAHKLVAQVLRIGPGSAASSGVFLAAPRRTGKSTFVCEDLRPAFEAAGAIVVYVDLWANPTAEPGSAIVSAIRKALASQDGVITRLAKSSGMSKIAIGGGTLQFDLEKIGLGKDVSLTDALVALSDEMKQTIVLVIDEAQHALTSDLGIAALFALKAARDELNSSKHHGLRVVCTGSNRDKLAMLRSSKDQAFYCAPMMNFPTLPKDFVAWFCANVSLPFALDADCVWQLFGEAGYRPELLNAAADQLRFEFDIDAEEGKKRFAQEVRQLTEEMNQVQRKAIRSLTPIQYAVLRVMAAMRQGYAPFEAETVQRYRKAVKQAGIPAEDIKVDVPGIQAVLLALQEKKLIWRAARGVYAIEEQSVIDLLSADGLLDGLA
ncbi:ATP-binding protein [Massilia sp. YIM B04103]|uniref:ATP-binding protein n=1 Tax=Massilia sp. YIM B04103 TaxID=2963106 RepID=UPI00210A7E47